MTAYGRGDVGSMAKNVMNFYKKATKGDAAQERALKTKTHPADVVMWSGSKDEQKSYVSLPDSYLFFLLLGRRDVSFLAVLRILWLWGVGGRC